MSHKHHVGADVAPRIWEACEARLREQGTSRRFMIEAGLCLFLGLPAPPEFKTAKKRRVKGVRSC